MSDWAAKLSQKPASGQAQSSKSHTQTSGNHSPTSTGASSQPKQNSPQINTQAKTRSTKPTRQEPTRQESPQNSAPVAEPFNAAETLSWLNTRYTADFEEAQADKSGEDVLIYRSLEASSSWKTKGPSSGRKHTKEDDRFDLVSEINRTFQPKVRRY